MVGSPGMPIGVGGGGERDFGERHTLMQFAAACRTCAAAELPE